MEQRLRIKIILCMMTSFLWTGAFAYGEDKDHMHTKHNSRISDQAIPLQIDDVPDPPRPLLEIGNPFLNTGPISEGFTLPTGAVWQPSFMAWGTYRTAVQSFYDGRDHTAEWANRFDLFGNLYLTQTERILAGVRFLDEDGRFTGYTFAAPDEDEHNTRFDEQLDFNIETLFFEGDLGEIFPFLDKHDKHGLDIGFSAGRQLLNFQGGMLINDNIDAIGITKTNLRPKGAVNWRSTLVWGASELHRTNLAQDDNSSSMFGWFNEVDFVKSTVAFDAIYVEANGEVGSGVFAGLDAVQRLGKFNTTFRVLGSVPTSDETFHNSAGVMLFGEVSWQPHSSVNHVYVNAFRGFDRFRSASRDTLAGGPLGRTGILFEAVGLGRYSSPISNGADDAFGGALGYQMFFDETRKQLTLELGGRYATNDTDQRAVGTGASFQMAVGQRSVVRVDGYAVYDKERSAESLSRDDYRFGGRIEFSFRF